MSKRFIAVAVFAFFTTSAFSQALHFTDPITGRPLKVYQMVGVKGHPFLHEDWKNAKVTLADKRVYDNIQVKFDIHRGIFYYNRNDSLYEFVDEVTEARLKDEDHPDEPGYDIVFKKDPRFDKSGKFIQVLADGKIRLGKTYTKLVEEETLNSTSYGISQGTPEKIKKLVLKTNQWALKNNQLIPVKYNSSNLKELTSDKKSEMEAFIAAKNLNVKKEMDFAAAISYYNMLHEGK